MNEGMSEWTNERVTGKLNPVMRSSAYGKTVVDVELLVRQSSSIVHVFAEHLQICYGP